jgi:cytochrome oxidase Cu insertion factor (SCO1/SenC/PrrC family)
LYVDTRRQKQSRLARNLSLATIVLGFAVGQGCHRTSAGKPSASRATSPALASAALTDHEGRALTFADFQGKTLVFSFFFASCPGVCPRETQALAQVQRRLSPELKTRVRFVSLSVDPENDTPAVLKKFGLANGADLSDWSFVRTNEHSTRALTEEFGVFGAAVNSKTTPAGHTTGAYLFDGSGRLMQRYAGSPLDAGRLAREIEQLDAWFRKKKAT